MKELIDIICNSKKRKKFIDFVYKVKDNFKCNIWLCINKNLNKLLYLVND